MIAGRTRVFVLVNTLMLWAATIVASSALWPIYAAPALIILVAVALPLGSLIAILGAVFRWPAWAVMVATVAGFLVVGVPVAVPSKAQFVVLPSLDGMLDLITGVALGWKQLLTITLPVGNYEALLVPALVLVLLTSVIGLSIALRARHGELAVIPPIVLFIVATAFGASYPNRPFDAPIALMVVVLFWLVWMRWYRRRAAIRRLAAASQEDGASALPADTSTAGLRTVIGATLILAIASTGAVVAANAVPPVQDRTVLRNAIEQPFDPREYVSPLAGFRRYLQPALADSVLFDVTGVPDGGRIRIATLDTYDGVVFSVGSDRVTSESGSFTRVPYRFDQSAVDGAAADVTVQVEAYSDIWVPTVGQLESVVFAGPNTEALRNSFYYNDTSGTAAVVQGLTAGDSFELESVVPVQPGAAQLAQLDPGPAVVPTATGVPEELTAKLDEYISGIDGPGARLAAMLDGLAAEGYISHGIADDEPPSRSGHAADRIAELLTSPRMIGDAEQYAVAAALMARDIGFPSRVVFGFEPSGERVTGSDVSAWIEVNTAQFGWVAIDPTPPVRDIPEEVPDETSQVSRPPTIVTPPLVEEDRLDRQTTPDSQQDIPQDLNPVLQTLLVVLRVLGWLAVAAAVAVAPFLVIIAAKLRRRRLRRKAPTAIERISGGWQEFEDAVVDHGLSPAASATRSEVASIVGGTQSQVLAAVADRAIFSPDDPPESDVDSVWRAVDELHHSLNNGLTRWQRLKARISLRSLGGYSVRKLFKR